MQTKNTKDDEKFYKKNNINIYKINPILEIYYDNNIQKKDDEMKGYWEIFNPIISKQESNIKQIELSNEESILPKKDEIDNKMSNVESIIQFYNQLIDKLEEVIVTWNLNNKKSNNVYNIDKQNSWIDKMKNNIKILVIKRNRALKLKEKLLNTKIISDDGKRSFCYSSELSSDDED